jgi:hypothetical protein
LSSSADTEGIVVQMVERYGCSPESVTCDVEMFVKQLRTSGLVEVQ